MSEDYTIETIKVQVEHNWLPPYRLEYDGKYVTLFGKDKDYLVPDYGGLGQVEYEEMVLRPCIIEIRRATPEILYTADGFLYINLNINEHDNH